MLRVTVELINANNGKRSVLGVLDIWNVSRLGRDSKRGDYKAAIYKKGTCSPEIPYRNGETIREGSTENYPRLSYPVWRLVLRILKSCYPEEKGNAENDRRPKLL